MGLGRGLVSLFKQWGKGIGNAADHVWLGADAQKAIRDEVEKKYKPKIDIAHTAESKRADNIKDLGDKLTQSKKELADAQKAWQDNYDNALADAKNKRQTDIGDYNAQLKTYNDALDNAKASRQSILDQLRNSEVIYDPSRTLFTDVTTGDKYLYDQITGQYRNITKEYQTLSPTKQQRLKKFIQGFDNRLLDSKSNKVINAFDDSNIQKYAGNKQWFDDYSNRIKAQNVAFRDAENQIKQAQGDLSKWKSNNSQPLAWNDNADLTLFKKDFMSNNGAKPTEYSFNGQNYSKESDLDNAYKDALDSEQRMQTLFRGSASRYTSKRDKEIAQRIQDAKDINKAKVALGLGTAGALAGATYAAFSGDDNSDTKPVSPTVTPQTTEDIETQFEHPAETDSISGISPRDQEAALADMAFKAASESDDTPAETHPETPELAELSADDIHTNEGIGTRRSMNEGLFSVIKALQDPHQANAVADYIYSRYGNDPELQQLGWRAWLNKYYGDALRSQMNLDASGYNGMHIA